MSRGLGFYLDLMDLISDGSVTLQFDTEGKVASITVERDEIKVDLGIPGLSYDLFQPFIAVERDGNEVCAEKRGHKWRSNTMMVKRFLKLFSGIEETFTERSKRLRIQYRGTDVLVIGLKEKSIMARLIGLKHISLPHKVELLRMVKDYWLSKPEPLCDDPHGDASDARKRIRRRERDRRPERG